MVRGYGHLHSDYLRAFEKARLSVSRCLEPPFGLREVEMQGPASRFVPEATGAAYLGLPAALIWELVREHLAG